MFSKVWFARAAAFHWLSPSVSIPTSRCMSGSAILIGIAERDVPFVGLFVERRRQRDGVHFDDELDRRFDLKVARPAQRLPETCVHRERPDLVGIGTPGFAIDPAQQRGKARFVV